MPPTSYRIIYAPRHRSSCIKGHAILPTNPHLPTLSHPTPATLYSAQLFYPIPPYLHNIPTNNVQRPPNLFKRCLRRLTRIFHHCKCTYQPSAERHGEEQHSIHATISPIQFASTSGRSTSPTQPPSRSERSATSERFVPGPPIQESPIRQASHRKRNGTV